MRIAQGYQKVAVPFFFSLSTVRIKETVANISLPEILCQKSLVKGQGSLGLDDFTHTVEVAFIIPEQEKNWLGTQSVVECGSVTFLYRSGSTDPFK